jgi:hypothetical protein
MSITKKTGASVRHTSAPPGMANVRLSTTMAAMIPTSNQGKPRRGRP